MPDQRRVEVKISESGYEWLTEKAAALSTGEKAVDMSDVIRLALAAYTDGKIDFSVAPHGGKRPGAGRKPKTS